MRRCMYCAGVLWPWQSQGWRYLTDRIVWRWHGSCWRKNLNAKEVIVGYINPDGSGRGNWAYPRPDADWQERAEWGAQEGAAYGE